MVIATGWNSSSMQNLVVQALTLRQLGRLSPRHLLTAGHGALQPAVWCPRTIHTRQLWGSSPFLTSGSAHSPAVRSRDCVRSWCVQQLRFKSNKKKGGVKSTTREAEDSEDERDTGDSDYEPEAEEDPGLPKDYKDLEKNVLSFRFDLIMKAGQDMARNKIEDAFYSNKLRLNGQNLSKKSKMVKVGDTLDMVLAENQDTNTVTLMRVVFKKVLGETNDGDKYKVALRRWKRIELPKADVFKFKS